MFNVQLQLQIYIILFLRVSNVNALFWFGTKNLSYQNSKLFYIIVSEVRTFVLWIWGSSFVHANLRINL